jgi:hypothetical protein
MEKTYLDYDLFIEAYEKNEKFRNMVYNDAYEVAMDQQYYDEVNLNIKGLEFKNHYNSWFFRLKDLKEFIYSLEEVQKITMILDDENEKLFKKVYEAFERFNCMNWNNKNYDILETWLENKANYFINLIEDWLKWYESDEYIETMIYDEFTSSRYEEYYILNNDISKIYYDKTLCY